MENKYPGVFDRVKAITMDSIVMIFFMFLASYIFSQFENVPDNIRIVVFLFIVLLYDPLFTSLFGGTIGHFTIGLRVKRESNEEKNISLLAAIPRYIVKVLLGTYSLATVSNRTKGKAIHDILVGSVVIYAKPKSESQN